MSLTPKREAFCLAFIETNVQARAYEKSHDTRRMTAKTIRKRAGELMKDPAVKARIAELRAAVAKEAVIDRSLIMRELHRLARMAMGDLPIRKIVMAGRGKDAKPVEYELHHVDIMGAAKTLELLGRLDEVRAFVDRHEHSGKGGAPLIPEDVPTRSIARAILDVLSAGVKPETELADEDNDTNSDAEADSTPAPSREVSSTSRRARAGDAGRPARASPTKRSPPVELEPGESEVLDNGATIQLNAEFGRYAVHDGNGRLAGHRAELTEARKLAKTLKAPTPKERNR